MFTHLLEKGQEGRCAVANASAAVFVILCISLSPAVYSQTADPRKENQTRMLTSQGVQFMQANRVKEGADAFWKAAQLAPRDAGVQYNLGAAFAKLGRWREAWQVFEKCTRLAPDDARNWFALAEAYNKCGDKAKAGEVINLTKRRFARNVSVQQTADEMLLALGDSSGLARGSGGTRGSQTAGAAPAVSASTGSLISAAGRLESEKKYDEAAVLLKQAAQREPGNWKVQALYSQTLCRAGKFKEALAPTKEAFRLNQSNPDLLQNIMYVQTQVGDLDGLQESRKTFVAKFPGDSRTSTISSEIKYYAEDFANIKQREQSGQATESTMAQAAFKRSDMPLKVYVHDRFKGRTTWSAQSGTSSGGINYSLLVEQAFNDWSAASGRAITFQFIDNPDYANIECEWTDDRSKLVHSFAAGVTQYKINKEGKLKGRIFLLTMPEGETFNSSVFYGVSLHEIGHALGMSHSSSPDDIMYFSETFKTSKNLPKLSQTDCNRIRSLYSGLR